MSEDGLLWWGYIHTNGTLQTKRWFSLEDITEARESPFVKALYGPFEANSRNNAEEVLKEYFKSRGTSLKHKGER